MNSDSYYQPAEAFEFTATISDVEHECTPELSDDDPNFFYFEGDVDADAWIWPGDRYFGYRWTCPHCKAEIEDEAEVDDPNDY